MHIHYRFLVLYVRMWRAIFRTLFLWPFRRRPRSDQPATGNGFAAFFSWRNPVAIFLGIGLMPAIILFAEGRHRPPMMSMPVQRQFAVNALRPETSEIILDRNTQGSCRMQLISAPFEPLTIHLHASVVQRTPSQGDLQVNVTPTRIGNGERPTIEVQLRAGNVSGWFLVQVQASDQEYKIATTTFVVKVR